MNGDIAHFRHAQLGAFEALTVVVAMPNGVVDSPPRPWSSAGASTGHSPARRRRWASPGGLLVLIVVGVGWLLWARGRDRRFVGSPVDQVMGNPTGTDQAVPLFEHGVAPVEFAPPEDLHAGQIGTIIDERANTLDVTATIIDLAVRGYLTIEEIPKEGWFGKPDWTLHRTDKADGDLLMYERTLLTNLFSTGTDVNALQPQGDVLGASGTRWRNSSTGTRSKRRLVPERPDKVRTAWHALGVLLLVVVGLALTFVLARWTHCGSGRDPGRRSAA